MKTSDFDYPLPAECIAQTPAEPRDSSRLLVLDRQGGWLRHAIFHQIGEYLQAGDVLVLNQTRVIPARLFGHKTPSGGRVEVLLLRRQDACTWEVLVGGKGLVAGRQIQIEDGPAAEVIAVLEGARRLVRFDQPIEESFIQAGHVPLPPYIHTPLANPERYQTVYANTPGSAAAPTAGLHFTPELLTRLQAQGVQIATVTLHVGLDTFAPVTEDHPQEHAIHTEWCQLSVEAAQTINRASEQGGRIFAVGTTSVRTLESAARRAAEMQASSGERVVPYEGNTDLFILPGYTFRAVDGMITNFHLPRSTLLMLVSAFTGRERILQTYLTAVNTGYRFYSFGDAMLIL